jgi:hypothetical protein
MAGVEFPWAALPWTLLLLLPLALFFSGILLAVSSFAANQKEADGNFIHRKREDQ